MFTIGQRYSKKDIYEILNVPEEYQGASWDKEYHQYDGKWFIFAKINETGRSDPQFFNKWINDDLLEWYGTIYSRRDTPDILSIIDEKSIKYIFTRKNNIDSFIFKGYGIVDLINGKEPVQINWKIVPSNPNPPSYPQDYYSWTILSPYIVIKNLDKTSLIHNETGIPAEIRSFFNCEFNKPGESISIHFTFNSSLCPAIIEIYETNSIRTRIRWNNEFGDYLKRSIHNSTDLFSKSDDAVDSLNIPKLRIKKTGNPVIYEVQIIDPSAINSDLYQEESPDVETKTKEGKKITVNSTRYERDPTLREKAMEYHGLNCAICGFNFAERYGDRGLRYIQIHHIIPLNQYEEEKVVDPKTDLIPVCANCHCMIHRSQKDVLSIEEMRAIIRG